jgi:hypothetical protein
MTFMPNLAEAELGKVIRDVSVGFLKYSGFSVLKDNTPPKRDMDLTLQDYRSFQDMARQNALFAERDFKTRNQKQRTGWGLVQRSRALSEGEAETPMGTAPITSPYIYLKFKTYLLTVC